jgi:HK97 family phage major capsid protein/HK97 family phage prohead protease
MLEVRSAPIGTVEGRTLTGYAALYNSWSKPLMGSRGEFREQIAPGAFNAAIQTGASLWFMHDSKQIIANTKSGTLVLESDERGLKYTATLGESQRDQDILDLVKRGVVSEMSFGFRVPEGGDQWSGRDRTLKSVDLREISLVEVGAYAGTSAEARSQPAPTIITKGNTVNIRTMNLKLAELRDAEKAVEAGTDAHAELRAQIEEMVEERAALLAKDAGVQVAATPAKRVAERREQQDEWLDSREYRDQFVAWCRGGRAPETRDLLTTSASGVLVPKLYSQEIMKYLAANTVVRNLADLRTGARGNVTLRYNNQETRAAVTQFWTTEASPVSQAYDGDYVEVNLPPVGGLPRSEVSHWLIKQADFDVEAEVVDHLQRQMSRGLEYGYTLGSGSNQPKGLFMNDTATNQVTASAAASATAWDAAFTVDKLTEIRYRSLPSEYWGSSVWVMSQDAYAAIASLKAASGSNVPIFQPSADAGLTGAAGQTLMGRPVYIAPWAPAKITAAGNNTPLVFGNVREAFSCVEWGNMGLIRDEITLAGTGRVKFQGMVFANSKITRAKAVTQFKITLT